MPRKPAPSLYFPGPRQLRAEGLAQHSQPAILIVVFGSDHTGVSLQTPHSLELGSWYHLLWIWFCAPTGRFVVIEISQVGCRLSLKVSQGNTAKSYIRKKGRWEKGWRKPAPELAITAMQGITGSFRGSVTPHPTPGLT